MLTIQEVHQNNVVIKEVLKEICDYQKKRAEEKARSREMRKSLGTVKYLCYNCFRLKELTANDKIDCAVNLLKFKLELYMKSHYSTAGLVSQYYQPDVSLSVTVQHGIIWDKILKKTVKVLPYRS